MKGIKIQKIQQSDTKIGSGAGCRTNFGLRRFAKIGNQNVLLMQLGPNFKDSMYFVSYDKCQADIDPI